MLREQRSEIGEVLDSGELWSSKDQGQGGFDVAAAAYCWIWRSSY